MGNFDRIQARDGLAHLPKCCVVDVEVVHLTDCSAHIGPSRDDSQLHSANSMMP